MLPGLLGNDLLLEPCVTNGDHVQHEKISSSLPASLTSPTPNGPLKCSNWSSPPASLEPMRALRSPSQYKLYIPFTSGCHIEEGLDF